MENEARYDLMQYSPVNWLMVDWHHNGVKFDRASLPKPKRHRKTVRIASEEPPCVMPIAPSIETYDWGKWLPEIIVGIDDPSDNIAADYARAAAIEFCKYSHVLQREIVVPLEPDNYVYPLVPVDFENILGVLAVKYNDGDSCFCSAGNTGYIDSMIPFMFDPAKSELHIRTNRCEPGDYVRVLVYAAPRENACEYDSFLYENFRREITMQARYDYAKAVHFRDRQLMYSINSLQQEAGDAWWKAKRRAASVNVIKVNPSTAFNGEHRWLR